MVLVDSSIWIEAFRRNGDVYAKLALTGLLNESEAAWCSVVKVEVLGGARKDERKSLIADFQTIPYLHVTEMDWEWAVKASWRLQEKGHVVKSTDLLVAAVAERRGIRVFARDKHFDVMRDVLGIALYTPGYNGMYNPGTE
jgi:hypothetical protein